MSKERRQYSGEYKFRMALEAAKNGKTVSQLASESGVHPTQISEWKAMLMREGASLFERRGAVKGEVGGKIERELYEQIGRLKMELEWLKKKLPDTVEGKRALVELGHRTISVRRSGRSPALPNPPHRWQSVYQTHLIFVTSWS